MGRKKLPSRISSIIVTVDSNQYVFSLDCEQNFLKSKKEMKSKLYKISKKIASIEEAKLNESVMFPPFIDETPLKNESNRYHAIFSNGIDLDYFDEVSNKEIDDLIHKLFN